MLIKKLFLVLLFISSDIIASNLNKFVIDSIQFEGLYHMTVDTALLNIPIHVGDVITHEDIGRTIRSLFDTKLFENIRVFLNNKKSLIIQVKERPIISDIIFQDNTTINTEILRNYCNTQGICKGKIFDRAVLFHIVRELENFYFDIGKCYAKIKTEIIPLPRNRVNIKLLFDENITVRIQKIKIIGNYIFNTRQLISLFQTKEYSLWKNIISDCTYKKDKLIQDLKNLYHFYHHRGYACFKINSTILSITPNHINAVITLNITEGMKYTITDIKIQNTQNNFKVEKFIQIKSGCIYNIDLINKTKDNIRKYLFCYGYMNPLVSSHLEMNNIKKTIKLYIYIDPKNRSYIRYIHFQGNNRTKDSVLRREIQQIESTWINYNTVNEDKKRLIQKKYFDTVYVETKPIKYISDQIDLIYKVQESNTGKINIGVGCGTKSGFNYQFNIQQNNLFGTGNFICLNSTKNDNQTCTYISMTNPYFTINNINLNNKIFYNDFNSNKINSFNYGLRNYGTNIRFNVPVDKHDFLNLGLDYIHYDITNIKSQMTIFRYLDSMKIHSKMNIIDTIRRNGQFSFNDILFLIGWNFDNIYYNYFPISGLKFNVIGKMTAPYSDNEYYKIIFNMHHYMMIFGNEKWILTYRALAGNLGRLGTKHVPFYDNFDDISDNTIRGFHPNTISPKSVCFSLNKSNIKNYNNCTWIKYNDDIGGNSMAIFSIECIFPSMFLFNFTNTKLIRTSLFIDSGIIWNTDYNQTKYMKISNTLNDRNSKYIRISSGISFQWLSPIGPLVLSYSYPIKKCIGDKLEPFQFHIGKTW